jgi:EAL domain-containing protein (putative c-di-GMP-specific phosphodiesterase class I)/GGDEF domain-containing protein
MNCVSPQVAQDVDELDAIIRHCALTTVFQPIIDLTNSAILGHEALIRGPQDSPLHSPIALFDVAHRSGRLMELELLSRLCSLRSYAAASGERKLFLNISSQALCDGNGAFSRFIAALRELAIPHHRVVLELSEQHPYENIEQVCKQVIVYRQLGFGIAIDDLGAGYSGLKLWSEVNPEYVKIDRHFIDGIDRSIVKREFVKSIVTISQGLSCQVIAEGIETLDELDVVRRLGIEIGQGYLFARPEPQLRYDIDNQQKLSKNFLQGRFLSISETARVLVHQAPTVAPDCLLPKVIDLLQRFPRIHTLPVLQDERVVGVLRRSELLGLFSSRFGRALYEKKSAIDFMRDDAVVVESTTPLEEVSRRITLNGGDLQQNVVITEAGRYLGLGYLDDLLSKITHLKVHNARYANPLTLLPGSVPLNSKIDQLLQARTDFHVAYIDLNNFKPYYDCYGYARGDQVLQWLAELLAKQAGALNSLVGHIGGDDFIVIFDAPQWQQCCEQVLAEFDRGIGRYYDAEHLEEGGLLAQDRRGNRTFYPLMGLAIGVVHPDPEQCHTYKEVASLAADAKREAKKSEAKKSEASMLFCSRRRAP